jgi:hypothetical protein
MSQVPHLVGRSGDQTRHRLSGLGRSRRSPLVEEDLAGELIGKAPLVQHAKHGLVLGGAEPPWAALADGRSVGFLRLGVTAERGHSIYPPHGLHAKGPTPDHEQLS